ncbi:probable elongation factor 1-delta isoform X2 [Drosophila bipectinata]|uniref:probable elongation factor 1-delta isoform X2 n=1 Tax=Drosophila bipectinata TaxID=42026 RepID=UPI001C8A0329|nr:probable elongation factor 1-delta isoform X3 [Drosophila bipectinata]
MKVEALDQFWTDKSRYDLAEKRFYEGTLKIDGVSLDNVSSSQLASRVSQLESDNKDLRQLLNAVLKRLDTVESQLKLTNGEVKKPEAPAKKEEKAEDDDDVDLFASESEDEGEEAARVREERLAAYNAKKSKKPALIAKSNIILDVKPWDDETDLKVMEAEIRKITLDGLLWGASKFVPVAFGIQKLSISCVVEDDKVSIDWLTEEIEKLEDFVQSVDIAAFNKI